jgi:hypothetical protein
MDELRTSLNCGDSCITMTDCDYISCGANQSPWGMAFAISFDEDVPFFRKEMKYNQFYLTENRGCADKVLVFQVCNSNAARDDNFDVMVNGVNIGSLDLGTDAQVGSVFIAGDGDITGSDFACPMGNIQVYRFSPSLLRIGSNNLQMINTQQNNNGNYGSVGIRSYTKEGNSLLDLVVIDNLIYAGGDGESFDFTFNLDRLC